MKDRVPTKMLSNGALRYGVYDEASGALLRYEYLKAEDAPTEEGSALCKANLLPDDIATKLDLTVENPQIKDALAKIPQILTGTATLSSASWSGSGPYTCTITASGVRAGDMPTVSRVTGTDIAAAALINAAWALVCSSGINPQVSADTIVFYATAKPTVAIPIQWEVSHT